MRLAALFVAVLLAAGSAGADEDLEWLLAFWQACLEEEAWAVIETPMTVDEVADEALRQCAPVRDEIEEALRGSQQAHGEDVVGAGLARLDHSVHEWLSRWVHRVRAWWFNAGRL